MKAYSAKDLWAYEDSLYTLQSALNIAKVYEVFTKDEVVTMLEELKKEIAEITISKATVPNEIFWNMGADAMKEETGTRIQQKIDKLKENTDG